MAVLASGAKRGFAEVEAQMVSDAGLAASALRSPELYEIVSEYGKLEGARADSGLRLAISAATLAHLTGDEPRRETLIAEAQRWCRKVGHISNCTHEGISTAVMDRAESADSQ